jgi:hypothetical protein
LLIFVEVSVFGFSHAHHQTSWLDPARLVFSLILVSCMFSFLLDLGLLYILHSPVAGSAKLP